MFLIPLSDDLMRERRSPPISIAMDGCVRDRKRGEGAG
jgi:hypothetical protein